MFIDTHCHLHDPEYGYNIPEILARARYQDVQKIITIGTSPTNNLQAAELAQKHPEIYWTLGFHPGEDCGANELEGLSSGHVISPVKKADCPVPKSCLKRSEFFFGSGGKLPFLHTRANHRPEESPSSSFAANKLVAIGEIGLDYHYHPYDRQKQIARLEKMLHLSKELNLPVIFHVREAFEDFWPIIDNFGIKNAIMHSFSDSQQNLKQALNRGFLVSVNGLATFSDIPIPPLESMLLETDAPYLTPKPFRGKINEPSYIKNIAEWVAEKLQVPFDEVADATTKNATQIFNL